MASSSGSTNGHSSAAAAVAVAATTATTPAASAAEMLATRFPVNSLQTLTLENGQEVTGRVYCTDEMTGSIVLQQSLVHTTLALEVRIIAADSVRTSKQLSETDSDPQAVVAATPLSQPLPKVQKKALEERERRAIRLAEENLRHINQKASPVGQAVFDRLLKACGQVVWKGETSILVLGQIQVDAPYAAENCKIAAGPNASNGYSLEDGSLDRVKKIVATVTVDDTTASESAVS